jgi:hypothetical protein
MLKRNLKASQKGGIEITRKAWLPISWRARAGESERILIEVELDRETVKGIYLRTDWRSESKTAG